jgi:hypothetical protein
MAPRRLLTKYCAKKGLFLLPVIRFWPKAAIFQRQLMADFCQSRQAEIDPQLPSVESHYSPTLPILMGRSRGVSARIWFERTASTGGVPAPSMYLKQQEQA